MIGYYVHHHGSGHALRFAALRAILPEVVGLGSGPRPDGVAAEAWVALSPDATQDAPRDPTAGGALHWAPLGEPGMLARTAQIAAWAEAAKPRALIVDVSVEVALTARLLGIPTLVVAQHGVRSDDAHRLAYRSAAAVVALWGPGDAPDPCGAEGRVHHVGLMSRFDGQPAPAVAESRPAPARPTRQAPASPASMRGRTSESAGEDRQIATFDPQTGTARASRTALLVLGRGGHDLAPAQVDAAIAGTQPDWDWQVLGDPTLGGRQVGPAELWEALHGADVVIGTAGNNTIADVAAARRPLILLPQARPFDEQHVHAELLRRRGLATVFETWPSAAAWGPALEATVAAGPPEWSTAHDGRGAERFAEATRAVVGAS